MSDKYFNESKRLKKFNKREELDEKNNLASSPSSTMSSKKVSPLSSNISTPADQSQFSSISSENSLVKVCDSKNSLQNETVIKTSKVYHEDFNQDNKNTLKTSLSFLTLLWGLSTAIGWNVFLICINYVYFEHIDGSESQKMVFKGIALWIATGVVASLIIPFSMNLMPIFLFTKIALISSSFGMILEAIFICVIKNYSTQDSNFSLRFNPILLGCMAITAAILSLADTVSYSGLYLFVSTVLSKAVVKKSNTESVNRQADDGENSSGLFFAGQALCGAVISLFGIVIHFISRNSSNGLVGNSKLIFSIAMFSIFSAIPLIALFFMMSVQKKVQQNSRETHQLKTQTKQKIFFKKALLLSWNYQLFIVLNYALTTIFVSMSAVKRITKLNISHSFSEVYLKYFWLENESALLQLGLITVFHFWDFIGKVIGGKAFGKLHQESSPKNSKGIKKFISLLSTVLLIFLTRILMWIYMVSQRHYANLKPSELPQWALFVFHDMLIYVMYILIGFSNGISVVFCALRYGNHELGPSVAVITPTSASCGILLGIALSQIEIYTAILK